MSEPIVSISSTQARARAAFAAGRPRDSHNMSWHAAALVVWLAEYDRVAHLARMEAQREKVAA
jgi:hypothetical protein